VSIALVVSCISAAVALMSAGFSGWMQLHVKELERKSKEEERRSEAKVVLDRYRGPLLDAAWQLGERVENIRKRQFFIYRIEGSRALEAVQTTSFRFAHYFGWREYLRTQVQLLRFENEEDTRLAAAFLSDITRALAGDTIDGPWAMLWSEEQRGIGELMAGGSPISSSIVYGYAALRRDYDKIFAEWMERFSGNLTEFAKVRNSSRLRLLQWALYGLVCRLDEQGAYAGGWIERTAKEISETPRQEASTTHEKDLRIHLAALER
jgi:hypothetical protein